MKEAPFPSCSKHAERKEAGRKGGGGQRANACAEKGNAPERVERERKEKEKSASTAPKFERALTNFFFLSSLSLSLFGESWANFASLAPPLQRSMPPDSASHPSESDVAFMRLALVEVRERESFKRASREKEKRIPSRKFDAFSFFSYSWT